MQSIDEYLKSKINNTMAQTIYFTKKEFQEAYEHPERINTYHFSYDATHYESEEPIQKILQLFIQNDVIIRCPYFKIIEGETYEIANIVRPVESTWIFHSEKSMAEIKSIIDDAFNGELHYIITKAVPEGDYIGYMLADKNLNSFDEELKKAEKTIEQQNNI